MWEKVHSVTQRQTGAAFPINYEFSHPTLILTAKASNSKLTWHRAGILYPALKIPEIGLVQSKSVLIKLGSQFIQIYNPQQYNYIVEFESVDWFIDITLDFWLNPNLHEMRIEKQLENLSLLAVESKENIALLQSQLDRIEQSMDTTTGQ